MSQSKKKTTKLQEVFAAAPTQQKNCKTRKTKDARGMRKSVKQSVEFSSSDQLRRTELSSSAQTTTRRYTRKLPDGGEEERTFVTRTQQSVERIRKTQIEFRVTGTIEHYEEKRVEQITLTLEALKQDLQNDDEHSTGQQLVEHISQAPPYPLIAALAPKTFLALSKFRRQVLGRIASTSITSSLQTLPPSAVPGALGLNCTEEQLQDLFRDTVEKSVPFPELFALSPTLYWPQSLGGLDVEDSSKIEEEKREWLEFQKGWCPKKFILSSGQDAKSLANMPTSLSAHLENSAPRKILRPSDPACKANPNDYVITPSMAIPRELLLNPKGGIELMECVIVDIMEPIVAQVVQGSPVRMRSLSESVARQVLAEFVDAGFGAPTFELALAGYLRECMPTWEQNSRGHTRAEFRKMIDEEPGANQTDELLAMFQ